MRKFYISLITLLFLSITNNSYARLIQYVKLGPAEGKIVDKNTYEPIENAIVIMIWNKGVGFEGGSETYYLEEAITNKDGIFKINEWEPKFLFNERRVRKYPDICIFKKGYNFNFIHEYRGELSGKTSKNKTDLATFKLEEFKGNIKEWDEKLSHITSVLSCKSISKLDAPLIFEEVKNERKTIKEKATIQNQTATNKYNENKSQ